MALAATGAYHCDKVISKFDAENAFNAIKRQVILNASEKLWPESAPFYDLFYNLRAPVFIIYYEMNITCIAA